MFSWIGLFRSPLNCHNPVIPGKTFSRSLWIPLYSSTINGISGLGPTKDISPFRTLMICGSSSRLVFLKNLPTRFQYTTNIFQHFFWIWAWSTIWQGLGPSSPDRNCLAKLLKTGCFMNCRFTQNTANCSMNFHTGDFPAVLKSILYWGQAPSPLKQRASQKSPPGISGDLSISKKISLSRKLLRQRLLVHRL